MFESYLKPPISFPTLTGSIVTFNAQYALPLKSLKCGIVATQDLHGYDHPWTGGNGKNKLYFQHTQPTTVQGVTFTTYPDGTVVANGTNTSSTTGAVFSQVIDTTNLSGNYYFVGGYGNDYDYSVYFWDNTIGARPKKWDGETNIDSSYDYTTLKEIQIVEGHKLSVMFSVKAGQTANNVVFKPMLLLSTETDPTFEPYENICPISGFDNIVITANGTPYTFNFGQTVYGGEYDARTGVLTVTHEIVDLSTLKWIYDENNVRFYTRSLVNIILPPSDNYTPIDGLCSHLHLISATKQYTTPNCIAVGTTGNVLAKAHDYTTVADFLKAFNGAKLVYPLANPQTIQLPPCPIDTLQGVNNIWADTGDTTLQYIKFG